MTKLFELAQTVRAANESGRVNKDAPSITDGMTALPFNPTPGLHDLSPEALLSLSIPTISFNEKNLSLSGFQRPLQVPHARRIARALVKGKEMPPILISIDEDGDALLTDGQHRTIGAIMARRPLRAVVELRTRRDAQDIFANQKLGVKVGNDVTILSGHSPYDEYIQDAVTDVNHPWFSLVGPGTAGGPGSNTKMTPSVARSMLVAYVGNQVGTKGGAGATDENLNSKWNVALADELASLILPFGTKTQRPDAHSAKALRALSVAATLVILRQDRHAKDIARWIDRMPSFNFNLYGHLSQVDLVDALLAHWNKRLRDENKIHRPRS